MEAIFTAIGLIFILGVALKIIKTAINKIFH